MLHLSLVNPPLDASLDQDRWGPFIINGRQNAGFNCSLAVKSSSSRKQKHHIPPPQRLGPAGIIRENES